MRPSANQERRKKERREAAKPAPAVSRGAVFIFMLIGLVGSLQVLVMIGVEVGRYAENVQEISRLKAGIGELEGELAGLQAIVDHRGDERYREHLARRQGFVFPDERGFTTLPAE